MQRSATWLMGALLLVAPALGVAQPSVKPGINAAYENADVNRWRGVFERDGREVWDRRHDIVAALGLRRGMTVADVGAGTGFFVELFADAVGPQGLVYAVDVTPSFVADIRMRASALGRRNIRGIVNTARSAMLPARGVDLVFTSDTYHHFEYPRSMLDSIHAALKPGGDLVIVDFKRLPGLSHPWVLSHVRAGEQTVVQEVEAAGFALVERNDFMQSQYFLRFRKR